MINTCLAIGLGSGKLKAPGTMGSLVAIIFWWLILSHLTIYSQLLFIISSLFYGVYICNICINDFGEKDPSSVVWDEFVGIWITCLSFTLFLPQTSTWLFISFVVFRFFDIIKPQPIRWIDRNMEGGWGVMLDDVLAALFSIIVLFLLWLVLSNYTFFL